MTTPNPHPYDPFRTRSDGGVGTSDDYSIPKKKNISFMSITTRIGEMAIIATLGAVGYVLISQGVNSYLSSKTQTITQNVIGNQQPETYIEKDGVRYYSRIDGKDISDLLKK